MCSQSVAVVWRGWVAGIERLCVYVCVGGGDLPVHGKGAGLGRALDAPGETGNKDPATGSAADDAEGVLSTVVAVVGVPLSVVMSQSPDAGVVCSDEGGGRGRDAWVRSFVESLAIMSD